jgi:hypothetical protein
MGNDREYVEDDTGGRMVNCLKGGRHTPFKDFGGLK